MKHATLNLIRQPEMTKIWQPKEYKQIFMRTKLLSFTFCILCAACSKIPNDAKIQNVILGTWYDETVGTITFRPDGGFRKDTDQGVGLGVWLVDNGSIVITTTNFDSRSETNIVHWNIVQINNQEFAHGININGKPVAFHPDGSPADFECRRLHTPNNSTNF